MLYLYNVLRMTTTDNCIKEILPEKMLLSVPRSFISQFSSYLGSSCPSI